MSDVQEWHHSGASCCTPFSTCLLSWFCPCITYGRAHHRLKSRGDMSTYSCTNGDCALHGLLSCFCLHWILQMKQRSTIRNRHHLKGGGCGDCFCACCCAPCDVTQQDKEAEYREALMNGQQPAKEPGMVYGR